MKTWTETNYEGLVMARSENSKSFKNLEKRKDRQGNVKSLFFLYKIPGHNVRHQTV